LPSIVCATLSVVGELDVPQSHGLREEQCERRITGGSVLHVDCLSDYSKVNMIAKIQSFNQVNMIKETGRQSLTFTEDAPLEE